MCPIDIRHKMLHNTGYEPRHEKSLIVYTGEELNKHIASVPILLIVLNYLYIVCLSIEINMFKLKV